MANKGTLYIIQGFIGAGKTTFSKKLTENIKAIYINIDESVVSMFDKDVYMKNWNFCFEKCLSIMWEQTKNLLSIGENVIFDMGFWLKKDRDYARNLAKQCGANVVHYYIYAPDEILKERIIKNRPIEWAKKHIENFENNKNKFEEPTEDENAIIINNF